MYFSISKNICGVRLGMIFRPDELEKIGKREKALLEFIEKIENEVEEIKRNVLSKLGVDRAFMLALIKTMEQEDYGCVVEDFFSEINRNSMEKINDLQQKIQTEFDKIKLTGTLSSAKREKIADWVFEMKDIVNQMENEGIKTKVFSKIPIEKIKENHITSTTKYKVKSALKKADNIFSRIVRITLYTILALIVLSVIVSFIGSSK